MKININNKYHAAFDGRLLGYVGETNARTIDIVQPIVENADTYRLRFEYSDGTVYDVEIVDGKITLTASILRETGEVNCQWIATKASGDTYELVAKSQVFALKIGESISDDVAPIPTYEQAQSMLDELNQGINSKITAPQVEGKAGQSLVSDGQGGAKWDDIEGVGYDDTEVRELIADNVQAIVDNTTAIESLDGSKADKSEIPTALSELDNDGNFVTDSNYQHTDNNYTSTEKQKLAGLFNYDDSEIRALIAQKATTADIATYINEHKEELKGDNGVGISNASINNDGELVITLTDSASINVGKVVGADGQSGSDGVDGISVTGATVNGSGDLVLSLSNSTTVNAGHVVGANGQDGYTPIRGTDYWTAEDIAVINTHNDSYIDTKFAEAEQDINSSVQRAEQAASSMSAKIDKNQGENNSGKFLAVGDDGNVTLVDDPTNRHDEDVLLGTLPYTINDNNCYITADSDATITNGGGATDIYAREGEYLVGSPTIEWGNRSAIITLGSNTVGVYTHLSFDWTPSKTYTLFWKSDLTESIIRILYRTTEGSATTEYLGPILVQGTQSASSIGSYNYTSFTVPEGTVRLNLAFGVNGSAASGRTITFYDLMILEGEYTAPPKSQTFTLYAGEKMPVDGYIGSTLECTNGVTVSVYQKQDSGDTDSGGVIFFGDSILDFSNVIERYSKKTGKSCIDCAVGGTRMSASRDPNNEYYKYDMTQIVDAIVNDDLSAQVRGGKTKAGFVALSTSNIAVYKAIVCEFGANDFTADVPFEGSTSSSVEGAMRYIIEQITTAYPSIRLVFVGTKRFVGIGVDDDTHIHADGTTEDMNAIMRKTCEEYGIPFIDMIHLFGDTAITRSTLTADGVHLREPQGAKRYADILTAQLNQIGI